MAEDDEDDPVALSSHTMDILKQFLAEKSKVEEQASNDPFAENWAMSQVSSCGMLTGQLCLP